MKRVGPIRIFPSHASCKVRIDCGVLFGDVVKKLYFMRCAFDYRMSFKLRKIILNLLPSFGSSRPCLNLHASLSTHVFLNRTKLDNYPAACRNVSHKHSMFILFNRLAPSILCKSIFRQLFRLRLRYLNLM